MLTQPNAGRDGDEDEQRQQRALRQGADDAEHDDPYRPRDRTRKRRLLEHAGDEKGDEEGADEIGQPIVARRAGQGAETRNGDSQGHWYLGPSRPGAPDEAPDGTTCPHHPGSERDAERTNRSKASEEGCAGHGASHRRGQRVIRGRV